MLQDTVYYQLIKEYGYSNRRGHFKKKPRKTKNIPGCNLHSGQKNPVENYRKESSGRSRKTGSSRNNPT